MWREQTGLLLFASVIQSATKWPHYLPSYVRSSIGSLCSLSFDCYLQPLLTLIIERLMCLCPQPTPDHTFSDRFRTGSQQIKILTFPELSSKNWNVQLCCWTWRAPPPTLAWMLLFASNTKLPAALAGHGPHLRELGRSQVLLLWNRLAGTCNLGGRTQEAQKGALLWGINACPGWSCSSQPCLDIWLNPYRYPIHQ